MKSQRIVSSVALVFLMLTTSPGFADAEGDRRLTRQMKGVWSLFVHGTAAAGSVLAPGGTALWAVATITFDGKGGCSSIDQIVIDGQFVPARDAFRSTEPGGSCTYVVNGDGTGFFDVVFPDAGPTNVTFVLTDRDTLSFIANNGSLGIYGGGEMKRQRLRSGGDT
jgi:hypothetical protein